MALFHLHGGVLLVFLITGVPFLMMLYASLLPFYQAPGVAAFESMSLANYWTLFQSSKTVLPMINSTILGPSGRHRRRAGGRADRLLRAEGRASGAGRFSIFSVLRRSHPERRLGAPSFGSISSRRCR
jgi:hypothetical protein